MISAMRLIDRLLPTLFLAALGLAASARPALAGPQIQHWTTPTGAQVLLVESRTLPLLDIQIDFDAGSALDPADKPGLAGFTQALLDGGAGELDEQTIAERKADLGAHIDGSTDSDRASISLRTLSSPAERDGAIELLATLLAQPGFPETVLARERNRATAALREALTKPAALAARQFNRALYPAHPYGGDVTPASLATLTRADLVDFHRRHYGANRASIAIVGDVDRATAEQIALRLTAGLPQVAAAPPLPTPAPTQAQLFRIANPSAQAHILVGQPGMTRDDPDYFPLLVGNYILGGGGFVSRLTREVRERRGYAYSVYSALAPRQVAGPFQIGLQTRGRQADDALAVVRATLAGFLADGPGAEELQGAKDNLINGFGLRLDSNAKLLDYVALIGFYRLPLDWLERYPQEVARVDAAAVRDAWQRRIQPAQLITVIAGGDGDSAAEPGESNRAATPARQP